jgi:hypothetical protein
VVRSPPGEFGGTEGVEVDGPHGEVLHYRDGDAWQVVDHPDEHGAWGTPMVISVLATTVGLGAWGTNSASSREKPPVSMRLWA